MNEDNFFQKCIKNQIFPRNDAKKQIILKRIMQDFDFNKVYTEQEVNIIIKKYFEDYTTIRRELINFGYMERNPYKGEYKVIKKELTNEDFSKISRLKEHREDLV